MKEKFKKFVKDHKKEIALVAVTSVISVVVCRKVSGPLVKDIKSEGIGFMKSDKVYWAVFDKNDEVLGRWRIDPDEFIKWCEETNNAVKEFCA